METIRRFFEPPKQSFFLFGPRGTGKSTLVRQEFRDALYIDVLDPETFRTFSATPEHLRERLAADQGISTVVIDEIQKVPGLLDLIHSLIEERPGLRFVLTGSSSRKLKRAGVDLLAGRAFLCRLHPFMAAEMGQHFSLEKALGTGMLPVVLGSDRPAKVLRAYVALYLREEVQMEGLVRNIGAFSRFLEAISFAHGGQLSISTVARDCRVERKVVEGYVTVLEDLLLGCRLPVFTKRAKRALVTHPKFYIFDAGVYRTLRPRGPLDRPEEIDGLALEGLVCQHLQAWIDYGADDSLLFYWRTRSGAEVDFVIYGAQGIYALEVKNAARIQPQDLRGLRSFTQDYPEARAFLLYRGKERLVKDGILCLPCEEFLRSLRPGSWRVNAILS
jgi:predicted AAA+ superfamily ATPase